MHKHMMPKVNQRLEDAKGCITEIARLPPDLIGFEKIWYSFLINFNGFFTILEQASKGNMDSIAWYSKIKQFRKDDPILSYLHHARNAEEHRGISSVMRSGFLLKPKTKNVSIAYRDSNGNRLEKIHVTATAGKEAVLEIIPPTIRFRSIEDRGIVYKFPKKYSHDILNGMPDVQSGSEPAFMKIAIRHAELIRDEANRLSKT